MEEYKEVSDTAIAGNIWFYAKTYRIFIIGLEAISSELDKYQGIIREFDLINTPFDAEKRRIREIVEYRKDELKKMKEFDYFFVSGVSYKSLRYLKSGGLFQVYTLEQKKKEILKDNFRVPKKLLQSIEDKINEIKDYAEQGVLNGLKPADIFLDLVDLSDEKNNLPKGLLNIAQQNVPTKSIMFSWDESYIVDKQLRGRCLSILNALPNDSSEQNQLDTIVREMSVILEERIRCVAGIQEKLIGVSLMNKVFAGNAPVLVFSQEKDVQDSAYFLYRGFSGFVRNEVMHKLIHTFTKERVLQLLSYVDYLLFLLTQAKKTLKDEATGSQLPLG